MFERDFNRMGGDLNARGDDADTDLDKLFSVQMQSIRRLDMNCEYPSRCGTCNSLHQLARFDAAVEAISELRHSFMSEREGFEGATR